jgi:hypothetical protein
MLEGNNNQPRVFACFVDRVQQHPQDSSFSSLGFLSQHHYTYWAFRGGNNRYSLDNMTDATGAEVSIVDTYGSSRGHD